MPYKCLIVDDEQPACDLINKYIQKIPELEVTEICHNVIEAKSILVNNKIDILFLDIQMPELSGVEFLRMLKEIPSTIFITAYSEYALEGYELDVVDYLIKPVEFGRFYKAVSKAIENLDLCNNLNKEKIPALQNYNQIENIFVKADKELIKLYVKDIMFIESQLEYVNIHTHSKKVLTLQSLSKFQEILPKNRFIRIHRSYIVNIDAINKIIGNTVFIQKHTIPISRGQKQIFLDLINKEKLF